VLDHIASNFIDKLVMTKFSTMVSLISLQLNPCNLDCL